MSSKVTKAVLLAMDTDSKLTVEHRSIKLRQLVDEYFNDSHKNNGMAYTYVHYSDGTKSYLNIRPKYQRDYVVGTNSAWQELLIDSVIHGYSINRIYFGVNSNGSLELIDGQQRLITLLTFVTTGGMCWYNNNKLSFAGLPQFVKDKILDYELEVDYCIGNENDRINFFRRINQPTSTLSNQELRNAAYTGKWLESAKSYFSRGANDGANSTVYTQKIDKEFGLSKYAAIIYGGALKVERQEVLEYALSLVSLVEYYDDEKLRDDEDARIIRYMGEHSGDENADALVAKYREIIDWVNDIFFHNGFYSEQSIKSQDWGSIYAKYHANTYTEEDKVRISEHCKTIVGCGSDLYSKSTGIYEWVLRGEKDEEIREFLQLRGFKEEERQEMWNEQGGIDPIDHKHYAFNEMVGHHLKSWKDGGATSKDNLVMLSIENHIKLHAGAFGLSPIQLREMRDAVRKEVALS